MSRQQPRAEYRHYVMFGETLPDGSVVFTCGYCGQRINTGRRSISETVEKLRRLVEELDEKEKR